VGKQQPLEHQPRLKLQLQLRNPRAKGRVKDEQGGAEPNLLWSPIRLTHLYIHRIHRIHLLAQIKPHSVGRVDIEIAAAFR
jgi:hypothetical protein